jgi:hypothetical protein
MRRLGLILFLLHSKPTRVRRAQYKTKSNATPTGKDEVKSISVHVTFISEQASEVVKEKLLWNLFSRVGEVTDVTVNKNDLDQVIEHVQNYPNYFYKRIKANLHINSLGWLYAKGIRICVFRIVRSRHCNGASRGPGVSQLYP